jgi:RNA polymerase primary sigma factor
MSVAAPHQTVATDPLTTSETANADRPLPTAQRPHRPLLELSDAATKTLVRAAKKRGYITHDQINALSKEINSEQIEDILAMFSGMGINVVESEEASDDEETENAL